MQEIRGRSCSSWPKSPPYLRHISTTSPCIWQENNAREIVQQLAADPHYFGTLCISPTSPPYLPHISSQTQRAHAVLTAWAEAMASEANFNAPDDQVRVVRVRARVLGLG